MWKKMSEVRDGDARWMWKVQGRRRNEVETGESVMFGPCGQKEIDEESLVELTETNGLF